MDSKIPQSKRIAMGDKTNGQHYAKGGPVKAGAGSGAKVKMTGGASGVKGVKTMPAKTPVPNAPMFTKKAKK